MTTNEQVQAAALKPCPFCGSKFLMAQEPHDNAPVNGMFYIFHDYGPIGSPARECPIDVRKHFDTEAEAIAAWNTRATPADPALDPATWQPISTKPQWVECEERGLYTSDDGGNLWYFRPTHWRALASGERT